MLIRVFVMLICKNLHKKNSEASITARSTPASLSFIGQVTKHTTVKWTIGEVVKRCGLFHGKNIFFVA